MPDAALAARGVYKPRRPKASPLFRLVSDHLHRLKTVYDDRFAREYGPWRPVVRQVADKFLAYGVLERGFARIRCDACSHEYLLAFSCKCRYFCPSCNAKHRQVVLTIPKRLRTHCLYRRRLLGEIACVPARSVTAAIRTLIAERGHAVGIVACLQTHGSRANWHPHLHLLVTDRGFRPDGTFVAWPVHDTARLTEAFSRAVLRLFLRLALFVEDQAAGMLAWPHSGFHVHNAVWVPEDDRAFAIRLARYCARNPVALERLTYDRTAKAVTYRSDKSEGPTAGTETVDPLEFLARVLVHIPEKGHMITRCYGWYANRPRCMREKAERVAADGPPATIPAPQLAATDATRHWAALLQQIFEVDPLACPTHLPRRDADRRVHHPGVRDRPDPRAPPWTGCPRVARGAAEPPIDVGPLEPGRVTRSTPVRRRPDRPLSTLHDAPGTFGVSGRPTTSSPRPPPAPCHAD